ncbi:MAG: hypothetical protein OXG49_01535, partial [Chloroflexi bacterium]|nr:hypothetical protein [Chloroflexota bacterium]
KITETVSTLADGQVLAPPKASPIPPPSDTPAPPTNTPVPPATATNTATATATPVPQQQSQTDGDLLTEIEAKIAHHRDETGRSDLVAAFTAARDALTGQGSVDAALALATYDSTIWNRIRAALQGMKNQNPPPPPPTNTPVPPTDTPVPPPTNTPVPPTDTPVPPTNTPVPPTDTPVPPTNTPVPPTNTPIPPTDTPVPPTNTPVPPTNTPVQPTDTPVPQQPQVDAGLLAEVEAKIARHRDETGRTDLEAAFSKVRDALKGDASPDEALAILQSGWNNDLWNRIRAALEGMR